MLLAACWLLSCLGLVRAETVVIDLLSGRQLTGQLDAATDAQHLWIRTTTASIEVRRPIEWQTIAALHYQNRSFSLAEARRAAPLWMQNSAAAHVPALSVTAQVEALPPGVVEGTAAEQFVAPGAFPRLAVVPVAPAVRTLGIDAWVANWDADVEIDGVQLHVYPLSAAGVVTPAAGTLHVELLGDERGFLHSGKPFHRLGSWTRQVQPEEVTIHGAVYRLPFQGVHPEYDLRVSPYALVNVRLAIPGVGTVSASQSDLRIRPYSIVRERVEQVTGQRFFPHEDTGRGKTTQAQVRP